MGLEVYVDLMSQPCRALVIFLKKNNIPFVQKTVELAKGQNYSEEFLAVNSLAKVPAILDDGFALAECVAILRYLLARYSSLVPDHWYPADVQQRARVDEYLSWQHTSVRPHAAKVFWLEVLIPIYTREPVEPEKVKEALEDLENTLVAMQRKFLKDQPFLCGQEISVADILALCELMQPVACGHDPLAPHPLLVAWRARTEEALGADLLAEVNACIMGAHDKLKNYLHPQGEGTLAVPPAIKHLQKLTR
ncbi:glutathione S-transferase theta-3-like [Lethenteron reissneri]|uniref:glutathione S-transferase theta-3-like n=2 Tax=Lethenteron reissneri TaxID=7753 RepID=UPI002AB6DBEE|nr:glutathione S-transferase theta-3-like [Lethenteron reissneri]